MKPTEKPKKTILLIDDQTSVLCLLSGMFSEEGFSVIAAPNYDIALELAKENKAKIKYVVSDLSDGKDLDSGFAFCRKLRDSGFKCPIIVHTDSITTPDVDRQLQKKSKSCRGKQANQKMWVSSAS